jgi:short-subunit dehydrogenase
VSDRIADLYPTAFVTGVGGGLGGAFAEMLLAEGVRVWGTARQPERLAGLAAASAGRFTAVALDLSKPTDAEAAFRSAAQQAGGAFNLVIQNAGYGVFGDFTETDFSAWQAQWEAMLLTTARLSHTALRAMRGRPRGCLVHISSLAAEFPLPFMAGYNVSKAALSALSESLIFETRGTGVRVIDFRPGDYRTDFNLAMQNRNAAPAAARPPHLATVWRSLEANLQAGPLPRQAASDLRGALRRGRSGVVYSGSFFQARLAPLLRRLAPAFLVRAAMNRYFGLT